jgi:hypothetical protein
MRGRTGPFIARPHMPRTAIPGCARIGLTLAVRLALADRLRECDGVRERDRDDDEMDGERDRGRRCRGGAALRFAGGRLRPVPGLFRAAMMPALHHLYTDAQKQSGSAISDDKVDKLPKPWLPLAPL